MRYCTAATSLLNASFAGESWVSLGANIGISDGVQPPSLPSQQK